MSDAERLARHRDPTRELKPPIDTDRLCPNCGYNLKGLRVGGVCPECGRTISFKVSRPVESRLHEARTGAMRLVQIGMTLAALGAFCVAVGSILHAFSYQAGAATQTLASGLWSSGLAALAFAVWSRDEPPSRRATVRRWLIGVAAATQTGWLGVAALVLLGGGGAVTAWVAGSFAAMAAIGLVPTVLSMAGLAEWIGDEPRDHRLKVAATLMVVFGAAVAANELFDLSFPMPILASVSAFGLLVTFGYILWSLFQLASSAWWASDVARIEREKAERLRERMRREQEEAEQRRRDAEPFGGPVPPPPGGMTSVDPSPQRGSTTDGS